MALGDERRASGRAMEANRRAIDGAMRAARQSTFKRDLNALESGTTARRSGALRSVEPRGGVPSSTARVDYTPPANTGGGGGIASPLDEQTRIEDGAVVPDRERWPEQTVSSTDGLLSFTIRPIKKTNFRDANNAEEVRNWAEP